MKHLTSVLCAAVSALILLAGTGYSSEQTKFSTVKRHSTKVRAYGADASERLSSVLVGSGIEGIPSASAAMTRSGGSIFWEKIRDKNDEDGNRHVFYRQFYRPPIGEVAAVSPVATAGAWLVGAEVGLHYNAYGTLVWVYGTQFEDVAATNTPVIGNAIDAAKTTDEVVNDWSGFPAADPKDLSPERVESRLAMTKLLLHSTGDGDSFDYVWRVPTWDERGSTHIATFDAENGDLISVGDTIVWSDCTPNSNDQDAAVGIPQNGDIDNRTVWATETDDRGVSYTHEAHKTSSSYNPDILVLMPMDGDGCDDEDYALMPVQTISGSPSYDNYTSPDSIAGKIAADALYFTYKTMKTFDDEGRDGWDDNGGDAVVVFDADCGYYVGQTWVEVRDASAMIYDGTVDWAPTPSVSVCLRSAQTYSEAAAIDIIAHEWGHGVIFDENLWDRTVGDGAIFHEGWADIVGHIVEWDNQPSGSDDEEADWEFGEDRGSAWRRADVDDGAGGHSYHANDTPGSSTDPYQNSLPLSVAFFLMADGDQPGSTNDHKNPWCETDSQNDDCDVTVSDFGVIKASRIMFETLVEQLASSSDWEDFAELAQWVAFDRYSSCPSDNAEDEQETVMDAFTAVGYGLTPSYFECEEDE